MVEYQFFYRKDTLQIDAVYIDSKTSSAKFKDSSVYNEVNVIDPDYEITRDHRVILQEDEVIGTEPSINPIQPILLKTELEKLTESMMAIGIHSYTDAQIDAFIDSVSTVAGLRDLLKKMAKAIVHMVKYTTGL